MRIIFSGVGEAFDERLPNCSVLVEHNGGSMLLDCGFTAASAFWRAAADPLALGGVYVSHFHGDHFFGLPHLLLRFWEQGRTAPLTLAGQPGLQDKVMTAMEMAYPGVADRFGYTLHWLKMRPGKEFHACGLTLTPAQSEHPQENWSVCVSHGSKTLFYSGDGRPTEDTLGLAQNADLIVHESFSLEPDVPGHGTVPGSIKFARRAGAKRLALVHLRRDVRWNRQDEVRAFMDQADGLDVFLPQPGCCLAL